MSSTSMFLFVGIILLALLVLGTVPGMISRTLEHRDRKRRNRHNVRPRERNSG